MEFLESQNVKHIYFSLTESELKLLDWALVSLIHLGQEENEALQKLSKSFYTTMVELDIYR